MNSNNNISNIVHSVTNIIWELGHRFIIIDFRICSTHTEKYGSTERSKKCREKTERKLKKRKEKKKKMTNDERNERKENCLNKS